MNALTNSKMKANRFAKWADARRKLNWINQQLSAGKTVHVTTMTKSTAYKAKHAEWFSATKAGLFVLSGKRSLCIDGNKISAQ